MTDARWLLIGGAGLVGRHLREALAERDVTVTAHNESVDGARPLDLGDPSSIRRTVTDVRPDIVILAAAEAWVERCEKEPEATRRINVDAAARVADAAPEATLVVISSEYVFDGTRGAYREDDATAPISEYGRQKVALERLAASHPHHLVCRVSGVYGWSERRTSFVAQVVDRLRAGERFRVPSDQLITPTPATDLARALVELIEKGAKGTFHVAGPEIVERVAFAHRIAQAFDLDAALIDPTPTSALGLSAARPPRAGLLTTKLRETLGRELRAIDDELARLRIGENAI